MGRFYQLIKKYHKWLGVTLAIFFMFFALSGIVMNHRGFFSRFDINRNWLPKEYRYSNWNNAAIKGVKEIGKDSLLAYGNIGIWLTENSFSKFTDFNKGFPKGIDNRKISDLHKAQSGELFAATLFGLYRLSNQDNAWQKVQLPIEEERIVAIEELGDSLLVVSRSHILLGYGKENYKTFSIIPLHGPFGAENRVTLFRTIWTIHSGEIWGNAGRIVVDIGGIAMILLSITGLFYFFAPKVLRRIKSKTSLKSKIKSANRWSFKWHLKVGIIVSVLLLVVTTTGMFLRPPLLIPIASKTVKPIKGSRLDSPNYWNDKLRDLVYDSHRKVFLLATSDGIYFTPANFSEPPFRVPLQPPVSVMGINLFWPENDGSFVVGSFSGLYNWNPYEYGLLDYLSGEEIEPISELSSPFGSLAIAGGAILPNGQKIFFDYNKGVFSTNSQFTIPQMPDVILKRSGMSLWNLALEVHTWRILGFIISNFYILIVPLAGILGLIIVMTGTLMWWIRYRAKTKG
ncbi:MAG: PepSY-associated TM helix domain-containing protein [Bacteroidales bacterium]|jgi:hypothetical protein|nr:PepSY-associated TM helix domain-containing protein [Bacteroidales bacterium]MDY0196775.1 PepSY-associated TM helix domain-containing protein [Tenuifilaceae bacterium]